MASDVNKAVRCKAKVRHSQAKAKDLGFNVRPKFSLKVKAKVLGCKAKASNCKVNAMGFQDHELQVQGQGQQFWP